MKESEKYDQYIQQKLESLHFPDDHDSWERMELLLKKEKKRRPLFFIPIGCLGILLLTAACIYLFYSSNYKTRTSIPIVTNTKDQLLKSNLPANKKINNYLNDLSKKDDHIIAKHPKVKLVIYTNDRNFIRSSLLTFKKYHHIKSDKMMVTRDSISKDAVGTIKYYSSPISHLSFAKPELFPLQAFRNEIIGTKSKPHPIKTKYELILGLGLNQQIPINGQSFVPYGNDGRKLSVSDYLPYLYGIYKLKSRISLEGQFRYGAPHYIRQVVYNQQKIDSFASQEHSYRYTLQKTYYHQLQLGINYSVSNKIDIGAGVQFNLFKSAVVKRDYVLKDLILNKDSIISSYQLVARDDSFFTRQHIDLNFHMNYHFKYFDAGIKTGMPLSSLLNYQDSSGKLEQEKSWYLNFYMRVPLIKIPKKYKKQHH